MLGLTRLDGEFASARNGTFRRIRPRVPKYVYHSLMSLLIDTLDTDHEGYLRRRADWTPELANELAETDGITLAEAHWEVINFLQEYYENYEIAPAIRILTKQIGKRYGREKGNSKYLYELFPRGPAKQACRYAGLPKPTGCV